MNFPIAMTSRQEPARSLRWLSPALALLLTVVAGAVIFAALGKDPVEALVTFFISPLDSLSGWAEVCVKMTPLLLCSVGLVVCFRANVWNIGAEGQLVAGAIAGGAVALMCNDTTGSWFVVLVMLASALGGALWGAITALLRHKFHANEILVSLMLEGTRLHAGALMAVIAALGIWVLMDKMEIGMEFKISGMAPLAARYAGYRPGHLIWISMLICGALAGLAGGIEAAGPLGQLTPTISPGYGFAAIIVAFVGRLTPLGCVPAAFIMALFYLGGELAQSRLGLPSSITGVYQGLLLFFILACDTMIFYQFKWIGFKKEAA